MSTFLLASALLLGTLAPQDPETDLRNRILARVREKLAAERQTILKKVEAIIDEELATAAPKAAAPKPASGPSEADKKLAELERRLKTLDEEREAARNELARLRREKEDEAVKAAAQKEIPRDADAVKALFDRGIAQHEQKKFDESVVVFKKIYYRFPDTEIGVISAYNVACGYALMGRKEEALDWLELCVRQGYEDFDHMRKDADLNSLREEKRYKKLLLDK
jgi:tetratricopeptide (TPR) repeat protein